MNVHAVANARLLVEALAFRRKKGWKRHWMQIDGQHHIIRPDGVKEVPAHLVNKQRRDLACESTTPVSVSVIAPFGLPCEHYTRVRHWTFRIAAALDLSFAELTEQVRVWRHREKLTLERESPTFQHAFVTTVTSRLVVEILEAERKSVVRHMVSLRGVFAKQNGVNRCLAQHFRLAYTLRFLDSVVDTTSSPIPSSRSSSSTSPSSSPTDSMMPSSPPPSSSPSRNSSSSSASFVALFPTPTATIGDRDATHRDDRRYDLPVTAEITAPTVTLHGELPRSNVRDRTLLWFDRTVTHGAEALDICIRETYTHIQRCTISGSCATARTCVPLSTSSRASVNADIYSDNEAAYRTPVELVVPYDLKPPHHTKSSSSSSKPDPRQLSAFLMQLVTQRTAIGLVLRRVHQDAVRSKEATCERLDALPSDSCSDFITTYKATANAFSMLSSIITP